MSTETSSLKLLLVEDSEDDEFLLLRALKKSGYQVRHQRVESAEDTRQALVAEPWDLVISDYNLPHFSALAALAVYHEVGKDLPFLIVSGTVGEETTVTALRSGAHDFLIEGILAVKMELLGHPRQRLRARTRADQVATLQELLFSSYVHSLWTLEALGTYRHLQAAAVRRYKHDLVAHLGESQRETVVRGLGQRDFIIVALRTIATRNTAGTGRRHCANSRKTSKLSRLSRSSGSAPAGSNTRDNLKGSPTWSTIRATASSPARSASKQSRSSRVEEAHRKCSKSSFKPAVP